MCVTSYCKEAECHLRLAHKLRDWDSTLQLRQALTENWALVLPLWAHYKIMLFPHELALTHVDATHSVVHNDIIHTVGQHVDSCYKTVGAQTACGAQCACPPIARAEFRSR